MNLSARARSVPESAPGRKARVPGLCASRCLSYRPGCGLMGAGGTARLAKQASEVGEATRPEPRGLHSATPRPSSVSDQEEFMPRPLQLEAHEAARLRHGLSKLEIQELWGLVEKTFPKAERTEERISDAIDALWQQYVAAVRCALDWEFDHPEATIERKPCISTIQAARALGIGEFHMSNLREHNLVEASYVKRRSFFARPTLEYLLDHPMEDRERHNPLGAAFVRWVAMRDAPYNARGLPVDISGASAAS